MKKVLLFLFFSLSICISFLRAQSEELPAPCGTVFSQTEIDHLISNKVHYANLASYRSNDTAWIPLQVHIVRDASGNGGVDEKRVIEMLCDLNSNFASLKVQFYFNAAFIYHNNDILYNYSNAQTCNNNMNSYITSNIRNVLNIFIGGPQNTTVGFAAYYMPPGGGRANDFIYGFQVSGGNSPYVGNHSLVYVHECGHYFSLPHTFHGWEGVNANTAVNGSNCVSQYVPGTNNETENVDRTGVNKNCDRAGDLFCDTEADYYGVGASGCGNSGGYKDFYCQTANPPSSNIMSYFTYNSCGAMFSTEQKTAMNADIVNRNYNYMPANKRLVTTTPQILVPVHIWDTLSPYNAVPVSVDTVLNANKYYYRVYRANILGSPMPNSTTPIDKGITSNPNNIVLHNLSPGTRYILQVWGYNEARTCMIFSNPSQRAFITASALPVDQVSSNIFKAELYPNPTSGNQEVNMTINLVKPEVIKMSIYNMAGQELYNSSNTLSAGDNLITAPLHGFSAGIYAIIIESGQGRKVLKLNITE